MTGISAANRNLDIKALGKFSFHSRKAGLSFHLTAKWKIYADITSGSFGEISMKAGSMAFGRADILLWEGQGFCLPAMMENERRSEDEFWSDR